MDLNGLIGMSRKYGGDPGFVLAGGGNTSYKEEGIMAVKASGSPLSVIDEAGFVLMEVEKLRALAADDYPDGDKEREERALMDMMAARLDGQGDKRPSVECILHALFRKSYVLHVHPALVNGLTCGKNGAAAAAELFEGAGDVFLWVPLTKPGYTLSRTCAKMFAGHAEAFGQYPSVALLQNHGIFVAGDTPEEVGLLMDEAVSRISKRVARRPDIEARSAGEEKAAIIAKELEALYGGAAGAAGAAVYLYNNEIASFTASRESYGPLMKPFSPDHIVYCRAYPVFAETADMLVDAFAEYEEAYGDKPKIVAIRGLGVFALGKDMAEAGLAAKLYIDAVKVAVYSESFGGPLNLPDDFTKFIANWEIESYRQKKALG